MAVTPSRDPRILPIAFSSPADTTLITLPRPLPPNRPTRPAICTYPSTDRPVTPPPESIPNTNTCSTAGKSIPRIVASVHTIRRASSRVGLDAALASKASALTPISRSSYTARCTPADAGSTNSATDDTSKANVVATASSVLGSNVDG